MSAIEIPATTSAQPEASQATTSQPESNTQPQGTPPAAPEGKSINKSGAEFAALDRRRKAVEKAELEHRNRVAEFEKRQSSAPNFEKTDTLELLEQIAKARGLEPDALIKEYIGRKTGGPTPSAALAQSTDPAIIALRDQMRKDAEEKEELRKKIEERDMREAERQKAEAEKQSKAACLDSAKSVYTDESDYAFFWDGPESLAGDVERACSQEIYEYVQKYKMQPEFGDVVEMVRDMPKELLKRKLESHAGKRVVALKQRAELPPPPAPVTGFKPPLRKSADGSQKEPTIRTRMDNDKRLEEAAARWPKGVLLPGQQPNSE
jgi:hypothetical protein